MNVILEMKFPKKTLTKLKFQRGMHTFSSGSKRPPKIFFVSKVVKLCQHKASISILGLIKPFQLEFFSH